MAKERRINLPETKGMFRLTGVVSGTEKGDKFYNEFKTKNNNDARKVSFGVETKKDNTNYVELTGYVKDKVYFFRNEDKKKKLAKDTKAIDWDKRNSFKAAGYNIIGVRLGLEKEILTNGTKKNKAVTAVEYDAADYVAKHLKDGSSVFIKGSIEYSSANDEEKGLKRYTKLVPNQISLCRDINFDDKDFTETNAFKQQFIFVSIEKDSDSKESRFIITGKVVTYNSIEPVEFVTYNSKLANNLRAKVKPYTAMTCWGRVVNRVETKTVTEENNSDDCWGEEDNFDVPNNPHVREIVITGLDPHSFDEQTYSEKEMDKAIKALNDFGESENGSSNDDDWGDVQDSGDEDFDTWE